MYLYKQFVSKIFNLLRNTFDIAFYKKNMCTSYFYDMSYIIYNEKSVLWGKSSLTWRIKFPDKRNVLRCN